MTFSPDGKYFLAGHHLSTVVLDTSARHEVQVSGRIRELLSNRFAFVGPDKILMTTAAGSSKALLLQFPSGEKLDSLDVGGSQMAAVTRGDCVLLHPLRDSPIGVFDLAKRQIVLSPKRQITVDAYDGVGVAERLNGELGLYPLGQTTPTAITTLPQSPLGPLTAVALSNNQDWLAVSGSTRGAIWDVSHNTRVAFLRSFHGAWFENDGAMYAEFPKFEKVDHSIARIDVHTGDAEGKVNLAEKTVEQAGEFLIVSSAKNVERFERKNGDLEFQDVKTGARLWTRHFDHEFPAWRVNPGAGTVLFSWLASSRGAKDEIQRFPTLHAGAALDLLIEVVNATTGKDIGAVLVNGATLNSYAVADGDWLAISEPNNRTVLYSISSAEEKLSVFGSHPKLSAVSGLLAVDEESGGVSDIRRPDRRQTAGLHLLYSRCLQAILFRWR